MQLCEYRYIFLCRFAIDRWVISLFQFLRSSNYTFRACILNLAKTCGRNIPANVAHAPAYHPNWCGHTTNHKPVHIFFKNTPISSALTVIWMLNNLAKDSEVVIWRRFLCEIEIGYNHFDIVLYPFCYLTVIFETTIFE